MTMSEMYERTFNRIAEIKKKKGYNVEYIWEHEFDAKIKKDKEYKKCIESLHPYYDPIDPREAI